ncbi:MAG: electron transport complex subunit RsxC [Gammaproteobacteria bacterium]|nr:electron transport complex subunit RsxC [Gammaproteobacteria bacterium]
MMRRLFNFQGGVKLREHKRESTQSPVIPANIPKTLILPLQQHIGSPAVATVNVGDKVLKGQVVAQAKGNVSVPVHAPTSGKVAAIGKHNIPHPSGLQSTCIIIETDGMDIERRQKSRFVNHKDLSPEQLRELIRQSGIVGLGGAGFPSHLKLSAERNRVKTLILNGAECEPYITCDEMLMREQAIEVIEGLNIMRHALQAPRCIIAIENNKPEALKEIKLAVKHNNLDFVEVVQVPTVYPAGGEKQLIQTVTGKQVPAQGLPIDIGVVCHNVGTAYAISRAVEHGEPLVSRYVTVAGSVAKARVLEVLIGTPVSDLIEECGGNRKTLSRVIMGGPMMGFALHNDDVPVIKTTNCILVNSSIADVPLPSRSKHALPCIRCGACSDACPVGLLPQQLYWHTRAKEFDKVQDYHLFDCIECGCCDYVCPSHIPLVQYYRYAKNTIWQQDREKKLSDISRQRHEFHKQRLEREKRERAERHKKKRQAVTADAAQDDKKAAIQAAMERARKKRETTNTMPKNTEQLTEQQQKHITEIDQRREKAPGPRTES